jgi:uncharacterized membrane protein (DUF441 family)
MESISGKELPLAARDIIQIDVTVIAGALVLLTLNSALNTGHPDPWLSKYWQYVITILTIAIIIPFASSAVLAMDQRMEKSKIWLRRGFIALMFELAVFAIIVFPY